MSTCALNFARPHRPGIPMPRTAVAIVAHVDQRESIRIRKIFNTLTMLNKLSKRASIGFQFRRQMRSALAGAQVGETYAH